MVELILQQLVVDIITNPNHRYHQGVGSIRSCHNSNFCRGDAVVVGSALTTTNKQRYVFIPRHGVGDDDDDDENKNNNSLV